MSRNGRVWYFTKTQLKKSYVSSRMMEAYAQKRQERKQGQNSMQVIKEEAEEAPKKVFLEDKEEEKVEEVPVVDIV